MFCLNLRADYENKALIIDEPLEALILRSQLIESAQSEILLMYYHFAEDADGLILLSMLKKAALRGVKIRIIIDSYMNKVSDQLFEDLMRTGDVGIEVYNKFKIHKPYAYTYRMHDKLVLIDQKYMLTGGRNVADPYFGHKHPKRPLDDINIVDFFEFVYQSIVGFSLSYIYDVFHEYLNDAFTREKTYIDRDVLLVGPIIKTARKYFIKRWKQEITKPVNLGIFNLMSPEREKLKKEAFQKYCNQWQCDKKFYRTYKELFYEECMDLNNTSQYRCKSLSRRLYSLAIRNEQKLASAKENIYAFDEDFQLSNGDQHDLQSLEGKSYLHLWEDNLKAVKKVYFLNKLTDRKIDGSKPTNNASLQISESLLYLLGNESGQHKLQAPYLVPTKELYSSFESSLSSGNEIMIHTNSLFSTDSLWAQAGYEKHKIKMLNMGISLYEQSDLKLLHSKSMAIGSKYSYIGTYNLDPRSQNLNSEIGVLVDDESFNQELNQSIDKQMYSTHLIDKDGIPMGLKQKYPNVPWFRLISYYKNRIILDFLPIIESQL